VTTTRPKDEKSPWHTDERWLAFRDKIGESACGPLYAYQSLDDPWFTTSYYLDTPVGVVVFDTQIFPESAEGLLAAILANTSGKLHSIVITHAHPDHYWGNAVFREYDPYVPILTSSGVRAEMLATAPALIENMPADWHNVTLESVIYPEIAFDGSSTLSFGGVTIHLWECGPAENHRQLVAWIPEQRAIVTGDLVQNHLTYAVQMQSAGAWRTIVAEIAALAPEQVLTGHIGPAGPEILDETIAWFDALLELSGRELGPDADPGSFALLGDDARQRIARELRERFPAWWDATMFGGTETIVEWSLRFSREQIGSKVAPVPDCGIAQYR
jgi:glyoxylase-like metal-dependent hydrolase (beta-lactamase superfamily II)